MKVNGWARPAQPAKVAIERNLGILVTLMFLQGFMLIMPVAVPLFQARGLSMAQVFQLQSIFALVIVVLEVPSGYLADRWGRRPTLILGGLFTGLGFTCLWFADGFGGLALYESLLAIGFSLVSGSDIAMLYDSARAAGRDDAAQQRLLGFGRSAAGWSGGIAAMLCGVLSSWGFEPVVLVQLTVGWLPFLLAWWLVEPRPAERDGEPVGGPDFREIVRHLGADRLLLYIFVALCFWGLSTMYGVWLLQKLWAMHDIPIVAFGWLWAVHSIAGALASGWAPMLEARLGPSRVLLLAAVLPPLGYAGLAYGDWVGAVCLGLTFFFARGVASVVLQHAFNRRLPSRFRATANSLASFAFRGGFMITGPMVGWVFDLWGMQCALLLCAAIAMALLVGLIVPLVASIEANRRGSVVPLRTPSAAPLAATPAVP